MTANQINAARQREDARHNLVMEGQGFQSITETARHNRVSEGIQASQVGEMIRNNMEQNAINWYAAEANAADVGSKIEDRVVGRENQGREIDIKEGELHVKQGQLENDVQGTKIQGFKAVTDRMLGWGDLMEKKRHNSATERETKRHNVSDEALGAFKAATGFVSTVTSIAAG